MVFVFNIAATPPSESNASTPAPEPAAEMFAESVASVLLIDLPAVDSTVQTDSIVIVGKYTWPHPLL